MCSPSRLAAQPGIAPKDVPIHHIAVPSSGVDTYEQLRAYTYNIQTLPPYNDGYGFLPHQPPTPPPSSYFLPSPTPYYPVYCADRIHIGSAMNNTMSMLPLVTDTHNYGSDAHGLPYAPPTTPASTVTDSYSPVTPHSPLAFPASPGQSAKADHDPARPEERVRGRHRAGSRSSTNSQSCFYRTKPCRFFHNSGFCIKGDRCNFIHDYAAMGPGHASGEKPHEEQPLGTKNDENRSSRRSSQPKPDVKRTNKRPSSPADNTKHNYYPITWRVIGGGVLMSGPRDVCQAFIAGHCSDGLDCRFSHPSVVDELEHSVAFTPPPMDPYYSLVDQWSPVSPLCVNPFAAAHMAPPSPITEDGSDDHAERFLTIDTLVPRPASNYFPARVILDGDTLLPRDSLSSEAFTEDENPPSFDELAVSIETEDDIGARGIVRPVSTPPSTSPSTAKVIRLFAAEMP